MSRFRWIDEQVDIDFDLPEPVRELISKIEEYDVNDKLTEYVCATDFLDAFAKGWIGDGLSQSQYESLIFKYK